MQFKVKLDDVDKEAEMIKNKDIVLQGCGKLHHHPSLAYLFAPNRQRSRSCELSSRHKVANLVEEDHYVAVYLRSLSCKILHILCNDRDFSHALLRKHTSPSYSAEEDGEYRRSSQDRDEHLATWADGVNNMPGSSVEIIESLAQIHEGRRKAHVWTLRRLRGLPVHNNSGVCKESITIMHWELRDEVWVCVELKMLNGVPGM